MDNAPVPQLPVTYVTTSDGYAAFDQSDVYMLTDSIYYIVMVSATAMKVIKTGDKGVTWTELLNVPDTIAGSTPLIAVFSEDKITVTMNHNAKAPSVYFTNDGGINWTQVTVTPFTTMRIASSVSYGSGGGYIWLALSISGTSYLIFRVDTDTSPFTAVQQSDYDTIGADGQAHILAMYSDTIGYSAINDSTAGLIKLYKTTDGATWSSVGTLASTPTALAQMSISAENSNLLYFTSADTNIYKSTDGAAITEFTPAAATGGIVGVALLTDQVIYLLSNTSVVYITTDGFTTDAVAASASQFTAAVGSYGFSSYGKDFYIVGRSATTVEIAYHSYRQLEDSAQLTPTEETFLIDLKDAYADYSNLINNTAYLGGSKTSDRLKMALANSYYVMVMEWFYTADSTDANSATAAEIWNVIQDFNNLTNNNLYIDIGQ